jgi:hypothetical protein
MERIRCSPKSSTDQGGWGKNRIKGVNLKNLYLSGKLTAINLNFIQ